MLGISIQVNYPVLIASITADHNSGAAPLDVNFGINVQQGALSDSQTYNWNFGDGSSGQSTSPSISHRFSTPGTYTVTVACSGKDGASYTLSGNVISGVGTQLLILGIPLGALAVHQLYFKHIRRKRTRRSRK